MLKLHINGIRFKNIHIIESKIYISYLKHHDSTLMLSSIIFTCHPFQPSSISLLRVGNTFSISSPLDVTKLQKIGLMPHRLAAFHCQCQWTHIFLSLTAPMTMGTQLGFKRHWESHYSAQFSRKLCFRHYYQWIFLQVALSLWVLEVHINGITLVTIHILEPKFKDLDLTLMLVFYYFYMSPLPNPPPYHCEGYI